MPQPMWCCCRCRPHRVVCDLHNAASARILAAAVAYPPRLPCSFRDSRAFPGPIRSEMRGCLVYRVVRSPLPIAGPQGHRSARQVRHTFPVPKVMNSTKSIDAAAVTTETVAKVAASPIEPHELTPTLTLDGTSAALSISPMVTHIHHASCACVHRLATRTDGTVPKRRHAPTSSRSSESRSRSRSRTAAARLVPLRPTVLRRVCHSHLRTHAQPHLV
jgi:hypothetical protein